MKKFFNKKIFIMMLTLVMVFAFSITTYAASCKNPTISKPWNAWCRGYSCGAVTISVHKGHELKELKVDGKKVAGNYKKYKDYFGEKCKCCGQKLYEYDLLLKKGTYKIEVKDDKGYWVTDYVTIKTKGNKNYHCIFYEPGMAWTVE